MAVENAARKGRSIEGTRGVARTIAPMSPHTLCMPLRVPAKAQVANTGTRRRIVTARLNNSMAVQVFREFAKCDWMTFDHHQFLPKRPTTSASSSTLFHTDSSTACLRPSCSCIRSSALLLVQHLPFVGT